MLTIEHKLNRVSDSKRYSALFNRNLDKCLRCLISLNESWISSKHMEAQAVNKSVDESMPAKGQSVSVMQESHGESSFEKHAAHSKLITFKREQHSVANIMPTHRRFCENSKQCKTAQVRSHFGEI